jgi:uncharacterized protein YecT (DUF1311 family)
MKLRLQLLILVAIALPLLDVAIAPSLAQDSSQQTPQVNCDSPQTTVEMNICASREYQVADKKLNSAYQALRSRLDGQQQKRITDAQLAWIKFRDATCAYERGEFQGGTAAGPTGTSCLARVTQQRTKELEGYLQDANNR